MEQLALTGTAALTGTGNAQNNVITANDAGDILRGLAGNDQLRGGAGVDQLQGGDGNDRLQGGGSADRMEGGAGNDTYLVEDAGDAVVELAGEGIDTVLTAMNYTLGANVERLTFTGDGSYTGTGNELANLLTANDAGDTLLGMAGNDTLRGGNGADVLLGGEGNDQLDGGAGADRLEGGAGNDTYVVDELGDLLVELANEGTDLVRSSVSFTLGAEFENLTLTGSANISGTGNALDNVITSNAGDNLLAGLAGNDTYVVNSMGDIVQEADNQGTDRVRSSVSYTLTANVENLTLTGTDAINGTGNELDNIIVGNSAANVLRGLAGNDQLTGGAKNDTLEGGVGNDRLNGGLGADTYLYGRGDGQDVLTDIDVTAGVQDVLRFGADIASDQLWFRKVGNNLEISVIGTSDKITLSGWYLGADHHVEVIAASWQ